MRSDPGSILPCCLTLVRLCNYSEPSFLISYEERGRTQEAKWDSGQGSYREISSNVIVWGMPKSSQNKAQSSSREMCTFRSSEDSCFFFFFLKKVSVTVCAHMYACMQRPELTLDVFLSYSLSCLRHTISLNLELANSAWLTSGSQRSRCRCLLSTEWQWVHACNAQVFTQVLRDQIHVPILVWNVLYWLSHVWRTRQLIKKYWAMSKFSGAGKGMV